jgi:hypothetical protein
LDLKALIAELVDCGMACRADDSSQVSIFLTLHEGGPVYTIDSFNTLTPSEDGIVFYISEVG